MPTLTRRGARNVTADLDRIASLFQHRFEALGVPRKVAVDFAYRCDLLSDHIERHAVQAAEEQVEEQDKAEGEDGKEAKKAADEADKSEKVEDKAEGEEGKEAKKQAAAPKKAEDETGTSVEPDGNGFDANEIGDQVSGPDEILPPVEGWMKGHFMQDWFQELRDLQEAGTLQSNAAKGAILTKNAVDSRVARLRRLASVSQLSVLQDVLKALQARLEGSPVSEVKSLAGEVGKQVAAVGKVRDLQIEQQVVGPADPLVLLAADRIVQVLSEEIPALKGVAIAVDADSPTAVLEAQKSVESLKELVSLSTSMINDAVKGTSKSESKKEAAKAPKTAPKAAAKKSDDEAESPKKDEEPEAKTAGKKSDDEPKDEDEGEGVEKEASEANDFGYSLSVA